MSDLRRDMRQGARGYEIRRSARSQGIAGVRDRNEVRVNGKPLTAREVSNEALGTGDSVVISSSGGEVHQERSRVERKREDRPVFHANVDVKILASGVDSSGTHIFIGGDRRNPTEILVLPVGETVVFSRIENLGKGKDRWIVALKTINGSNSYKIYTKFGEDPARDWVLTGKEVPVLYYAGNGFWSGLIEQPVINFETINPPDTVGNTLTFFFDNRPGEVRGIINCGLTEQEFWTVPEVSKSYRFYNSSGFAPTPSAPWVFTGTNTLISNLTVRCYWYGSPPISPSFYPYGNYILREETVILNRELITQYPSFSAMNGALETYSGSYVYTEHRDDKSTYLFRRYQGIDDSLPAGSNSSIGFDDALTISTTIKLGPNFSKPLTINPATRPSLSLNPLVDFDIPLPIDNFEGGTVFSRLTGKAAFNYVGVIFAGFEAPFTGVANKQYLKLKDGTEKEAKFSYSYPDRSYYYYHRIFPPGGLVPSLVTWRQEDSPYPIMRDIGGLPSVDTQYSPAVSPLLKRKWDWTIKMTKPVDTGGVLDYTASTAPVEEKKSTTYAVILSDSLTTQKVLDAR